MGDMADFHLEEVVDMENSRALFHSGRMSDNEAFGHGFLDPSGAIEPFAGSYSDYCSVNTPESLDRELSDTESMLSGQSSWFNFVGGSCTDSNSGGVYRMSPAEEENYFIKTLKEKYSDSYIKGMMKELKESSVAVLHNGANKEVITSYLGKLVGKYPKAYEALDYLLQAVYGSTLTGKGVVNNLAVDMAVSRTNPTCNICLKEMSAKNGRFGKFYFCSNQCPEQPTVSDKYWQDFKIKAKNNK